MSHSLTEPALRQKLLQMLAPAFPEMSVEIVQDPRRKKRVLTFRWTGFDALLPEERFHRLMSMIPEDFHGTHLRNCVWFELGSRETPETYLKLPRSEDMRGRAAEIVARLEGIGFASRLAENLGTDPQATCQGDFSHTRRALAALKTSAAGVREAVLVLMGRGAFCDCHALKDLRPGPASAKAR